MCDRGLDARNNLGRIHPFRNPDRHPTRSHTLEATTHPSRNTTNQPHPHGFPPPQRSLANSHSTAPPRHRHGPDTTIGQRPDEWRPRRAPRPTPSAGIYQWWDAGHRRTLAEPSGATTGRAAASPHPATPEPCQCPTTATAPCQPPPVTSAPLHVPHLRRADRRRSKPQLPWPLPPGVACPGMRCLLCSRPTRPWSAQHTAVDSPR